MTKRSCRGFLLLALTLCALCLPLSGCSKGAQSTAATAPEAATTAAETTTAQPTTQAAAPAEFIDYAAQLTLDLSSGTKKQEVTVRSFVDGDTTHFNVPEELCADGVLKARYLAVNTPESTGKIEEWGKTASDFTKAHLSAATSIILESDDENWNMDSTSTRYLVWVWYRCSDNEPYRNLNLELLQNGLAIANSSAQNRYGETCQAAILNARALKLNIYSGEKDPNFYYGEAQELTLKELRLNLEKYVGTKVAFEGLITHNNNNTSYVEVADPETGLSFGLAVYYGFSITFDNGTGRDIMQGVGNYVRVVGTLEYYENGGTYQVAGLSYRAMKPKDPDNLQLISKGNAIEYREITPAEMEEEYTIELDGETFEASFAELCMDTAVELHSLQVKRYSTTETGGSSDGALTLYCTAADGSEISVRTTVLYDESSKLITGDRYEGKTIDVKGLVSIFNGEYQVKCFSAQDITIHES